MQILAPKELKKVAQEKYNKKIPSSLEFIKIKKRERYQRK